MLFCMSIVDCLVKELGYCNASTQYPLVCDSFSGLVLIVVLVGKLQFRYFMMKHGIKL